MFESREVVVAVSDVGQVFTMEVNPADLLARILANREGDSVDWAF
jgi:hypothetical protein